MLLSDLTVRQFVFIMCYTIGVIMAIVFLAVYVVIPAIKYLISLFLDTVINFTLFIFLKKRKIR